MSRRKVPYGLTFDHLRLADEQRSRWPLDGTTSLAGLLNEIEF